MVTRSQLFRVLLFSFFGLAALLMAYGPAAATTAKPIAKPALAPGAAKNQLPAEAELAAAPVGGHKPSMLIDAADAIRPADLENGVHQRYLDTLMLPANLQPSAAASPVALWLDTRQPPVAGSIGANSLASASDDLDRQISGDAASVRQSAYSSRRSVLADLTGSNIDPNMHQYFVPFDDQDLIALLRESNACQGQQGGANSVGDIVASRISLTASSDDTIFFYDHWEDGYDANPLNRGESTERGVLSKGTAKVWEDDVNTADPNWGTTFYYDGRDRITIFGDPVQMLRAASPSSTDSPIGTRLAGAWEVDEASNWGTEYIVPAGEDWGAGADFQFTGASVTALQNGTQVFLNGAPFDPLEPTIDAGETLFVNGANDGLGGGGLDSGDTITATGPIQVHIFGSTCNSRVWSGNGYTLEPLGEWTSDYYSPVPSRTAGPTCTSSAEMDIFLYNNTAAAFNIMIDDGTPNTVSLPPGSSSARTLNGGALSDTQGVHIFAPGGEPFWAVTNFDTRNVNHEWGYSLIPLDQLSSKVVFGWAPGNLETPPKEQYPPSGNLAFVMAITDTVVYADFDQDGSTDLIDCNGDGDTIDLGVDGICDEPNSDAGITLPRGLTLRIADPDADLQGATIYTRELAEKLAVAWGQDSCVAQGGVPYIDMGYTVLPVPIPIVGKSASLQDVDGSNDVSRGDLVDYTISIKNNGEGPLRNFVITDRLPYSYTDFVVGSIATTSSPPPLPAPDDEYFDGVSWAYVPTPSGRFNVDPAVQQFRLTWPTIGPGQKVTVTLDVQIQSDVPLDVKRISNRVIYCPSCPGSDLITDTIPLGFPVLQIDKLYSGPATVRPGDLLTYTVVVSNVGTASAANTLVTDTLPPWVTYVTDSLDLTWPTAHVITTVTPISEVTELFDDTYGDDFDLIGHGSGTTSYSGSDGTLPWLNDWSEINDDGASASGDISVLSNAANANSPYGYLQIIDTDGVDSGLRRCADLSDFFEPHLSYRVEGDTTNSAVDDQYRVVVTSTITTITFTERFDTPAYESRDLDLSDLDGDSQVCMTFFAEAGMDAGDRYRIDGVWVYDALSERTEPFDLIQTSTVTSYTTLSNINPVTYTRIPPAPTTVAVTNTIVFTHAFPFPPQSRFTATFQLRLGTPLTDGLQILNTACVTSTNVITQPYPPCDQADPVVRSDHALTITKSNEPVCRGLGDPVTYNLSWEVAGDEPAPGVVVTDSLPSYLSFESCAGCDETSPGVVTWDLGNRLPAMSGITQDSGPLTLTVRVNARPPGGVVTNTVIIDDATDTPPAEDDEPTIIPDYSFDLSKQRIQPITDTADINDTIVFQIVITNTGLLSITHLPLKDAYDPFYLRRESVVPPPDIVSNTVSQTVLLWDDLTNLTPDLVLPPGLSTQVVLTFTAIHTTTDLPNGVTINTAVSEGALAGSGQLLCDLDDNASAVIAIETAIELLYFRAGPRAGGVWVEWATLLEIDTYGFWLYRSTDTDVSHSIPVAFVPAQGWGSLGASYDYLDTDLPPGEYYYWLVEVETGGKQTTYGPINASPGWDTTDLPYRVYLPLIQQP